MRYLPQKIQANYETSYYKLATYCGTLLLLAKWQQGFQAHGVQWCVLLETKLELGSPDFAFMNPHKINRIYLRIFDVTAEASGSSSTFQLMVRSAHSKKTKREDLTLESMVFRITFGSDGRKRSLWKR